MNAPHRIDVLPGHPEPYVERLDKQGVHGSTAVKFPKWNEAIENR